MILLLAATVVAAPVPATHAAVPAPGKPAGKPGEIKSDAVTPMAERVVRLAALNKRNGQTQEFTAHPGDTLRFATLTVRVRACETTPPWEARQTAAYLQIDDAPVQVRTATVHAPRRVFSGWMFAESPSLNPLEHPLYDVWVRSCTMRFPGHRARYRGRRPVGGVPVEGGEVPRRCQGRVEQSLIGRARHFNRPEPFEMIGQELRVEQPEPADPKPRDERRKGAFRCVGHPREHAFAEERRPQLDPVQPADEAAVLPALDRMGVAAREQPAIGGDDRRIDPRLGTLGRRLGASCHDAGKVAVGGDAEALRAQHLGETAGQMKAVERQDAALLRLDPEHVARGAVVGHREDAERIGAEQHLGVEVPGHAVPAHSGGWRWCQSVARSSA